MKYRIQELYKQTNEIQNTGALQTNRWNTEYRNTTNKQMKHRIQEHYKQTDEIHNTGTLQTNKWNTEHKNTTNKQMKYRTQELYKQTNEIQNTGALQTNRWNTQWNMRLKKNTTNLHQHLVLIRSLFSLHSLIDGVYPRPKTKTRSTIMR
jgi:hypothetical protein